MADGGGGCRVGAGHDLIGLARDRRAGRGGGDRAVGSSRRLCVRFKIRNLELESAGERPLYEQQAAATEAH